MLVVDPSGTRRMRGSAVGRLRALAYAPPVDPDAEIDALIAAEASARRKRTLQSAALIVLGGPWLLVTGVAALLLVVAETTRGRAMGLGFVAAGVAVAALVLAGPHLRRRFAAPAAIALIAFTYACAAAPDGAAIAPTALHPGRGLQSVWTRGATFPRFGIPNLTPEGCQGRLATFLVPFMDAYLDHDEAAAFRGSVSEVYAELEADPSYARAGSVQGIAYSELLTGAEGAGHAWVDFADAPEPQPALVFIHGFGGNLKGYTWVLRKVAHEHGYAIVAPSYGAGLWYQEGGTEAVADTLRWMEESGRFAMDRLVLAGLSNGGYGVSAAVVDQPGRWQGVAYLSGVLDDVDAPRVGAVLAAHPRADGKPPPVLVLHGAADDRIPLGYLELGIAGLRAGGVDPDVDIVDGADHFLMFTHRARLEAAVGRWLGAVEGR